MATATLSTPLTLNPTQAVTIAVRQAILHVASGTVHVFYDLLDAGGNIVDSRNEVYPAATYVANQGITITNGLLTKLGLTGTVT